MRSISRPMFMFYSLVVSHLILVKGIDSFFKGNTEWAYIFFLIAVLLFCTSVVVAFTTRKFLFFFYMELSIGLIFICWQGIQALLEQSNFMVDISLFGIPVVLFIFLSVFQIVKSSRRGSRSQSGR